MIAIGDKVVCINDQLNPASLKFFDYPNGFTKKGQIYVVEALEIYNFLDIGPTLSFHLIGLPCFFIPTNIKCPWMGHSFRKLEDVKMENELKYYKENSVL